jgi:hypothetical protein
LSYIAPLISRNGGAALLNLLLTDAAISVVRFKGLVLCCDGGRLLLN